MELEELEELVELEELEELVELEELEAMLVLDKTRFSSNLNNFFILRSVP